MTQKWLKYPLYWRYIVNACDRQINLLRVAYNDSQRDLHWLHRSNFDWPPAWFIPCSFFFSSFSCGETHVTSEQEKDVPLLKLQRKLHHQPPSFRAWTTLYCSVLVDLKKKRKSLFFFFLPLLHADIHSEWRQRQSGYREREEESRTSSQLRRQVRTTETGN